MFISLTYSFTLTAVRMARYICPHLLIPAGEGKRPSVVVNHSFLFVSTPVVMALIPLQYALPGFAVYLFTTVLYLVSLL